MVQRVQTASRRVAPVTPFRGGDLDGPPGEVNSTTGLDGMESRRDNIIAHRSSRRPYHPKRRPAPSRADQPAGSPPAVLITWPAAPSVTNTDPRGLASVAAAVVRVLAEAQ